MRFILSPPKPKTILSHQNQVSTHLYLIRRPTVVTVLFSYNTRRQSLFIYSFTALSDYLCLSETELCCHSAFPWVRQSSVWTVYMGEIQGSIGVNLWTTFISQWKSGQLFSSQFCVRFSGMGSCKQVFEHDKITHWAITMGVFRGAAGAAPPPIEEIFLPR